MIALLQRVSRAHVDVEGRRIGSIGPGLLTLIGVQKGDTQIQADRLLDRLLAYRVFADEQGKMNLGVASVGGQLLLVPQFTLAADTRQGNRPGFSTAAPPAEGRALFEYFVSRARLRLGVVETGEFGAHMEVSLTNDGPVTFWLQVDPD